jgi:ssDNA-binding protein
MSEADEKRKPGTARYTLTEPVVMAFPHLITSRQFSKGGKASGEPKFSANFVFAPDSADLKAIKALTAKIAREVWPGIDLKTNFGKPWSDGTALADQAKKDKKAEKEFYRGNIVLAAHTGEKYPPKLSSFENGTVVDYEGDARKAAAGKFYAGVEVLAQFNLSVWDSPKGKGVTAYLNMVFSTGKGTRHQTGQSAAEVFKGYVGTVSNEDPTAGQFTADEF